MDAPEVTQIEEEKGEVQETGIVQEKTEKQVDLRFCDETLFNLEYFLQTCKDPTNLPREEWRNIVYFLKGYGHNMEKSCKLLNKYCKPANVSENEKLWKKAEYCAINTGSMVLYAEKLCKDYDKNTMFPPVILNNSDLCSLTFDDLCEIIESKGKNKTYRLLDDFKRTFILLNQHGQTKYIYKERIELENFSTRPIFYEFVENESNPFAGFPLPMGFSEKLVGDKRVKKKLTSTGFFSEIKMKLPRKKGLRFEPTKNFESKLYFNAWSPNPLHSYVSTKQVDIEKTNLMYWLREIICTGSETKFNYQINCFQKKIGPDSRRKLDKVLVYFSKTTASGKSAVIAFLKSLLGDRRVLKVPTISSLYKNFNSHFLGKQFVIADDVQTLTRKETEQMKQKVSEKTYLLEKKNENSVVMKSFADIIMTTNEMSGFHIDQQDRRIEQINVLEKNQPDEFWTTFHQELEDIEIMKAMYDFIQKFSIKVDVRSKNCKFDPDMMTRLRVSRPTRTIDFLLNFFTQFEAIQSFSPTNKIRTVLLKKDQFCFKLKHLYAEFEMEMSRSKNIPKEATFRDDVEGFGLKIFKTWSRNEKCPFIKINDRIFVECFNKFFQTDLLEKFEDYSPRIDEFKPIFKKRDFERQKKMKQATIEEY